MLGSLPLQMVLNGLRGRGGIVPGVPEEQNSYRSELACQLSIATFFDAFIFPGSSYHTYTVCDGLATLNTVGTAPEIKSTGTRI